MNEDLLNEIIKLDCMETQDIESLKAENKQLKEKIMLLQSSEPMLRLTKYYWKTEKLESALEEIKEYVTRKDFINYDKHEGTLEKLLRRRDDLLQIIDKGLNDE